MNTPLALLFQHSQVATIVDFGYETPWATGRVEFIDKLFFAKLANVTTMGDFSSDVEALNLSDDEAEKLWENKLIELGLCSEDLNLNDDGKWSIRPNQEGEREIYGVRFDKRGFVDWR